METEPVVINFAESYAEHLKGFASAECPDLNILIDNEILKVHKIILASRNEAFKGMLESQLVESKENQLEITDCDPAGFKIFLAYLYTTQLRPEDISLELLKIAEKYKDLELKKLCFDKLGGEISMENFVETTQLATQSNFQELLTGCKKFFIENYMSLIGTPQLEAILQNKAFLSEIFEEYDTVAKKHDELIRLKKHKFLLGEVGNAIPDKRRKSKGNPREDQLRFIAEDVEWMLEISCNSAGMIGINLNAEGKKVRADVELTVLSKDPNTPNMTLEKKNELFGQQFFPILHRRKLNKDEAYVRRNKNFIIEIFIDVLSVES